MAHYVIIAELLMLCSGFISVKTEFQDETLSGREYISNGNLAASQCHRKARPQSNYELLVKSIMDMRKQCGLLCTDKSPLNTENNVTLHDRIYDPIFGKQPVVCESLWNTSIFDLPSTFQAPIQILPKYLLDHFSLKGRIKLTPHYYADLDNENTVTNSWAWSEEGLSVQGEWLRKNQLRGNYGNEVIFRIRHLLRKYIPAEDKSFLVIGSVRPWIEVILLAEGAKHITTLEYNPYPCDHPNITTISPSNLSKLINSGLVPQFDAVVSFSSLEHSGLGRYGDHLNPWGDVIAMARAWCLLKPKGRALIGLPAGKDEICFNSHRKYGPFFFHRLFVNWRLIFSEVNPDVFKQKNDCWNIEQQKYQPINILEK